MPAPRHYLSNTSNDGGRSVTRYRLYEIKPCANETYSTVERCQSFSGNPSWGIDKWARCVGCQRDGTREVRTEVVVESPSNLWRYCCEEGHHCIGSDPNYATCTAELATVGGGHIVCGADIVIREFDFVEVPQ